MSSKINVLSLFDGMSCGRLALDRIGADYWYWASEIDKSAIAVALRNYPDTVPLGDIENWRDWPIDWASIDLIMGGSPCQGFSFAGKQLAFDDPRSRLFFVFVDILNHVRRVNPRVKFLLENVKMNREHMQIITDYLGVDPVFINSALVSAQNRQRWYWFNWDAPQPDDRGILLKDIIELEPREFTLMSDRFVNRQKGRTCLITIDKDKASNLSAMEYVKNGRQGDYIACNPAGAALVTRVGDKLRVREATKKGYAEAGPGEGLDLTFPTSKTRRGRAMTTKSNCLTAANYDYVIVSDDLCYRKLTPIECERLQTVPDNYTAGVSNTQRYKMLGNGWTVEVIAHLLRYAGLA